jgi:hypothetical protein
MSTNCEDYRKRILESSIEDLSPNERQTLEAHLAGCLFCSEEQRLTLDTLQQLRSESDVAVPRHFFVGVEELRPTPWSLFRQMTVTWKAATALALLASGALVVMIVSGFQVRTQAGALTLSFGKPSEPKDGATQHLVNVDNLKTDILQALEEKSHQEHLVWLEEMRKELAQSNHKLTQKQQKSMETALAGLEARVNDQMSARDLSLQASWKQSLGNMYEAVQTQRKRDLMLTNNRLNRLVTQGEQKSNETEAILETLLQVAEYKIK